MPTTTTPSMIHCGRADSPWKRSAANATRVSPLDNHSTTNSTISKTAATTRRSTSDGERATISTAAAAVAFRALGSASPSTCPVSVARTCSLLHPIRMKRPGPTTRRAARWGEVAVGRLVGAPLDRARLGRASLSRPPSSGRRGRLALGEPHVAAAVGQRQHERGVGDLVGLDPDEVGQVLVGQRARRGRRSG